MCSFLMLTTITSCHLSGGREVKQHPEHSQSLHHRPVSASYFTITTDHKTMVAAEHAKDLFKSLTSSPVRLANPLLCQSLRCIPPGWLGRVLYVPSQDREAWIRTISAQPRR